MSDEHHDSVAAGAERFLAGLNEGLGFIGDFEALLASWRSRVERVDRSGGDPRLRPMLALMLRAAADEIEASG